MTTTERERERTGWERLRKRLEGMRKDGASIADERESTRSHGITRAEGHENAATHEQEEERKEAPAMVRKRRRPIIRQNARERGQREGQGQD